MEAVPASDSVIMGTAVGRRELVRPSEAATVEDGLPARSERDLIRSTGHFGRDAHEMQSEAVHSRFRGLVEGTVELMNYDLR